MSHCGDCDSMGYGGTVGLYMFSEEIGYESCLLGGDNQLTIALKFSVTIAKANFPRSAFQNQDL